MYIYWIHLHTHTRAPTRVNPSRSPLAARQGVGEAVTIIA